MEETDPWLTIGQVAALLDLSKTAIRKAFENGEIAGRKTSEAPGAHRQIRQSEAKAYALKLERRKEQNDGA